MCTHVAVLLAPHAQHLSMRGLLHQNDHSDHSPNTLLIPRPSHSVCLLDTDRAIKHFTGSHLEGLLGDLHHLHTYLKCLLISKCKGNCALQKRGEQCMDMLTFVSFLNAAVFLKNS